MNAARQRNHGRLLPGGRIPFLFYIIIICLAVILPSCGNTEAESSRIEELDEPGTSTGDMLIDPWDDIALLTILPPWLQSDLSAASMPAPAGHRLEAYRIVRTVREDSSLLSPGPEELDLLEVFRDSGLPLLPPALISGLLVTLSRPSTLVFYRLSDDSFHELVLGGGPFLSAIWDPRVPDRLFVSGEQGQLAAVNIGNEAPPGEIVWQRDYLSPVRILAADFTGEPGGEASIWVAGSRGWLSRNSAEDGRELFRHDASFALRGAALNPGRSELILLGEDRILRAPAQATGNAESGSGTAGDEDRRQTVSQLNLPFDNALDMQGRGDMLWILFSPEERGRTDQTAQDTNDALLAALNLAEGSMEWSRLLSGVERFYPAAPGELLLSGSQGLQALDPANGRLRYRLPRETGVGIPQHPLEISGETYLYPASFEGDQPGLLKDLVRPVEDSLETWFQLPGSENQDFIPVYRRPGADRDSVAGTVHSDIHRGEDYRIFLPVADLPVSLILDIPGRVSGRFHAEAEAELLLRIFDEQGSELLSSLDKVSLEPELDYSLSRGRYRLEIRDPADNSSPASGSMAKILLTHTRFR